MTSDEQVLIKDLRNVNLSFIGCGVMAESIIAGLLSRKLVKTSQIVGSHPRLARRDELQETYGFRMVESNRAAAQLTNSAGEDSKISSDSIVILAVKPQRLGVVLAELKGALSPSQLVLSIVAGARIVTIANELAHSAVVRAMPNPRRESVRA
jgi:pyrroline-5-carboxylate reductase